MNIREYYYNMSKIKKVLFFTFLLMITISASAFLFGRMHPRQAQANFNGGTIISNEANNEIVEFCKKNSNLNLCKDSNYISKVNNKVYSSILPNYIKDYKNKASISHIAITGHNEIKLVCNNKSAVACWNGSNIAVRWMNYTYQAENKAYSVVAHEMLHAYASGHSYDLYPFEEGVVDSLSYEIPEMSVYKSIGYPQYRAAVHEIAYIYKTQGWGNTAINIYTKMIREKTAGMRKKLGTVNLTKITVHNCKTQSIVSQPVDATEELNDLLYCKKFMDADSLISKLKAKFIKSETSSKNGENSGVLNATIYPKLIKPGDQFSLKYNAKNSSAKSVYVLLTKPNSSLETSPKSTLAQYIANNKMGYSYACKNGKCSNNILLVDNNKLGSADYFLKVVAMTSSVKPGEKPTKASDILDTISGKVDVQVAGSSKGSNKIQINSPSSAEVGSRVNVNLGFKGLKGQELMLWITDCSGKFIPKISESDEKRKISSNNFSYPYLWDTQKANTEVCMHTIRAKTFLKGILSDSKEAKINIVSAKGDVCIAGIENIKTDVSDFNVTLSWDSICGANYYKIYRNNTIISTVQNNGFTDSDLSPGEYEYKVEAWSEEAPDKYTEQINEKKNIDNEGSESDQSDENNQIDGSVSQIYNSNRFLNFLGFGSAKAAEETKPITTKTIKVKVADDGKGVGTTDPKKTASGTCDKPKIKLAIPFPTLHGKIDCVENLQEFFKLTYEYIGGLVALLAVLMTVYGGIKYISSQGNPQVIEEAKAIIMGGLIGLAVLLSAGLFIEIFGQ